MNKSVDLSIILNDISVLAENTKNILAMANDSQETDELSNEMRSVLYIGIDSLHRIVKLAESAEQSDI